jgi:hypothetical protein
VSSLTPAFQAELAKPALILFGAVEILLPGPTPVRLLDGAGVATFGGRTFVGRDETFGVLGGVSDFSDGLDDQAPNRRPTRPWRPWRPRRPRARPSPSGSAPWMR